MIVLVPAYQPAGTLVTLVESIRRTDPDLMVLVVDDGSGAGFDDIFAGVEALDGEVVRYDGNRGKGHALKTGFEHIAARYPGADVVCADGDGQHAVADILRVAEQLRRSPAAIVLGIRSFAGDVPLRSRWGNAASRVLFRLATGRTVADTQTGLRGYPAGMLDWLLSVPGERYEYEYTVLLRAADAGLDIQTVGIATIYLDANESSHFRPVADSARIYWPLLKFAVSSLTAFVMDTAALLVLSATTGSLILSVAGARMVSSAVNFAANRRIVFEHGRDKPTVAAASEYLILVVGLLTLNYLSLVGVQALGVPLLPAKVITEVALFAVSYAVQRRVVFAGSVRRRMARRPTASIHH